MFVVFWRSTIAPGSRSVHKPETSHQSYRSLTIGKRCYKMEANTYDQATPQPWERQLRPIPETSPAVINLNSNGTFEASFSPPSSSTTPRKHSRLSLSRNKRERKLREQALADGSSSGSGSGSDHSPELNSSINQDICVNSNNCSGISEKETNGFRGGDDTLQRLGIGGDGRERIGLPKCSDEGNEETDRGFNFDLDEMDSSSSSENDGSEAGSDSRDQQEKLHVDANANSSAMTNALFWETNSSDMPSAESTLASNHGQQRQQIFLDQDDSDSDQDVFNMSARKRTRRRITICDDDEEDDQMNCHDLDKKMAAGRGTFQTSDDLLLSPTRDESDHDSEHNLCLAQQTCTYSSGSPLLSPTREVAAMPATTAIRDGLRTSPYPHLPFARSHIGKPSPQANDDIESSDSDNSGESGEDDLEIIPSRKSKHVAPEREVICLDSDEDESYNQNAQRESPRRSLLPSWGAQIMHRQDRPVPSSTSSKKRLRPMSSSTFTDAVRARSTMASTLLASARTSSTTSRSNSLRRVSTAAPILPSDLYSNRRDLSGGSGLGLGGFQVRTEYQSDNGEEEEQAQAPPPARKKRAAASTSRRKTATKTAAKGRKRKGGGKKTSRKGGRKNYRPRGGNSGGAWSANEQGISNYRSGRNSNSNSNNGEPYMDVKRIDPNLGNAGGASISFE